MRVRKFCDLFWDVAVRQAYMVWVTLPGEEHAPRECVIREYYCAEPDCDCRVVLLDVASGKEELASIVFGWEEADYYLRLGGNAEYVEGIRKGAFDALNPAGEWGEIVLPQVRKELLSDPKVRVRFRRHYEMFKRELRKRARCAGRKGAGAQAGSPKPPPDSRITLAGLLGIRSGRGCRPRWRLE